jgi:diaminohydroxyphosphoribosylaminopyrimidine deaminase/5-amino-6-(5-phosphoribosylamino)uracil reductase
MYMESDLQYMTRALEIAEWGSGATRPNPLVGAVLVKQGKIIGEGYHQAYGGPHAEIYALREAGVEAEGSTLYVTLEPCSHHGKTPPCAEAIAKANVKKVVCAISDPNPLVQGKGLAYLQEQGIETSCGLSAEQARKQNEIFLHFITTKTPFVLLKTAMSLDGKIATKTGESRWITSGQSRSYVHRLRNRYAAIMVGIGTVLADDPVLTTRMEGRNGHNPLRIVMDSRARTPLNSRLIRTIDEAPVMIVTSEKALPEQEKALRSAGAEVLKVPGEGQAKRIREVVKILGERGVDSLLVEGGGTLANSFIQAQAVQKYLAFIAPLVIGGKDARTPVEGEGITSLSDAAQLTITAVEHLGPDILIEAYPVGSTPCLQD